MAAPNSERLYIHFDRTEFRAGDAIRFKAYVLLDGSPSTRSTHFYIQVFNEKGISVSVGHFPVLGATVDGGIVLPDTLSSGNYYVQAFTPYMLLNSSDVYVKNIWVSGSGFRAQPRESGVLSNMQFFPEGGSLHADQLNLVVFRSVDAWEIPLRPKALFKRWTVKPLLPFKRSCPDWGLFVSRLGLGCNIARSSIQAHFHFRYLLW